MNLFTHTLREGDSASKTTLVREINELRREKEVPLDR